MDILVFMRNRKAFTLVELLTVMAVIAILAAITFGISAGVYERQARTKAKAEVSSLASALEAYRAEYGMYPETAGESLPPSEILLRALADRLVPESDEGSVSMEDNDDPGRPLVEPGNFDVRNWEQGAAEDFGEPGQEFVDPWGNAYVYEYSTADGWNRFGFVLYSRGPDGDHEPPENGISDKDAEDNADNIYLNN